MTILIILVIILLAGLAIRHYQVKCKHAVSHWQFERSKHEEYRNSYYSKFDELEQCQTMLGMAKFEKKQSERKAAESNKHVMKLQEKNLVLTLERNDLQLNRDKANAVIAKVHNLLNSGAKGQETLAALVETGEYLKKA